MTTEIDTDALISSIEARPCLWNKFEPDYKDRIKVKNAWSEVYSLLREDYDSLDDKEKTAFGQAVTKRWNNIRDAFRRSLRIETRRRSEDGALKLKKYVYFEQLRFLKTIFDERPTEGTLSAPDENVTSDIEEEVDSDDPAPLESWTSDTSSSRKTSFSKKRGKSDELEEQMLKVLKEKEHPLFSFWKGLMPGIADFSSDEILDLQSEIIVTIRNIRKKRQNPVLISPTRSMPLPQDIMYPHNRSYIPFYNEFPFKYFKENESKSSRKEKVQKRDLS